MKKLIIFSIIIFSFANSAYAVKPFLVEKGGSDKVLISDGYTEYVLEHNYECFDSDFTDGSVIYIDTTYSPIYGDKIIITGGYSNKICEVTSADSVNIKKYYVDKVLDSEDKIIVLDKDGNQLLVEYGLGCGLSMWRYEGKIVDIDVGGAFLDGIGDHMYLFEQGRDCKIWDAEELSSYPQEFTPASNFQSQSAPVSCPANSTNVNGTCYCNTGYRANGAICLVDSQPATPTTSQGPGVIYPNIDPTEVCTQKLGSQGVVTGQNSCGCASGYEIVNNYCVVAKICPLNSTKIGQLCQCNTGYQMNNQNQCGIVTPIPKKENIQNTTPVTKKVVPQELKTPKKVVDQEEENIDKIEIATTSATSSIATSTDVNLTKATTTNSSVTQKIPWYKKILNFIWRF